MSTSLTVENLRTYYYAKKRIVPAVDGVSFKLEKGETLGIVGESGCGKSTVARAILGLYNKNNTRIESGSVKYHDLELTTLSNKEFQKLRGSNISMIFQDPFVSLDPVYTVGSQIGEIFRAKMKISKKEAWDKAVEMMRMVGIPSPEVRANDYPYQMSGGMQQRVMIAIALALRPEILIADEPTTALDVTVQAQILEIMKNLSKELQMSVILITHNMGVVAQTCDRLLVMYGGVVVEEGACTTLFDTPMHPYTEGLLAAIPSIHTDKDELHAIRGVVPAFRHPVTCCRFHDRCPYATDRCAKEEPPMFELEPGHSARCWKYEGGKVL